ncbi:DUF3592 domain-containing protein [Mariniradius sediminis]|jgi:hypothetical protein|uniref:DUF3592 domain-containing protein n=1 Tax=Mariniradius sediminis TaxID=2909237 RepID=A0ABS9BUR4_9BACT|nr:DUF3592 domain-containing protein [Mariniradius sediminis]MCF1751795.1 DUF3592 domain-containing protein [Mariniradius sediminis]
MELILIKGFDGGEELISNYAAWEEVEACFDTIDWHSFHILILRKDNQNSVDVGGSLVDDGLSASMMVAGTVHVIENPPENLRMAKQILKAYFDDSKLAFERYFITKGDDPKYKVYSYQGECRRVRSWIYGLAIIAIVAILGYLTLGDELRFIGKDIDHARAKVVDIRLQPFGGRYFFQKVTYEYTLDGVPYSGQFTAGKRQGYMRLGDEIKVRYLKSEPSVSDYVGKFVKVEKHRLNSSVEAKRQKHLEKEPRDSL